MYILHTLIKCQSLFMVIQDGTKSGLCLDLFHPIIGET